MVTIPLLDVLDKRHLILHFSFMNIKLKFKGSYLGLIWTALEPLLMFLILYVVFSSIRDTPKEDFGIYLITGVMFYHLFSRGTMTGLASLKDNASILKSFNLKKELFPVIATGTTCLFLFVEIGVLFGLMPVLGFVPEWTVILLPVILGLFLLLVLGACYLLSVLYVFIRDIQPFWGIFVYALLFVSPIFWYISEVDGILLEVHKINPLGQLIELSHQVVIFGLIPSAFDWIYTSSIILGIFFTSFAIFKKFETRLVEKL